MSMDFPTVLVVDFGAQYAQLIARRIREAGVYSELVGSDVPVEELLARKPAAIVLSGGPSSVYAADAPQVNPAVFEAGVPAFGICYGFQAMALSLGGTVARTGNAEFGRTPLEVVGGDATLFQRADMVETGWAMVQPILDVWGALAARNFPNYRAGTWGPVEADALLERDGRHWENFGA